MGSISREKKIGLAIILVLLLALGGVLTARLMFTKGQPLASLATAQETASDKQSAAHPAAGVQPMVLSPSNAPSLTAKQPVKEVQWAVASDSEPRKEPGPMHHRSPPSLMPNPSGGLADSASNPPSPPPSAPSGPALSVGAPPPPPAPPPPAPFSASHGPRSPEMAGPPFPPPALPPLRDPRPEVSIVDNPLREGPRAIAREEGYRQSPRGPEPQGPSGGRYGESSAPASEAAMSTYRQTSRYGNPPAPETSFAPPPPTALTGASGAPGMGLPGLGPRPTQEHLRRPDGTYKVQPNDSFWSISEKLYGSGAYFKALAEHNRAKTPRDDRLQPGSLILAPTVAELEKDYPDACPKPNHRRPAGGARTATVSNTALQPGRRIYVVVEGDTLSDIAKFELGRRSRWGEIYEINRERLGDDYDYSAPGTELVLPEAEPANHLTNRPGPIYRR